MDILLRPLLLCSLPVLLPKFQTTGTSISLELPPRPSSPSPHVRTSLSIYSRFSLVSFATPESQVGEEVDIDTRDWAMQDFYSSRKEVETTSERVEEIRNSAGLLQLDQELAVLELKAADKHSLWFRFFG